jgi:predicted transcriptional regulator
VTPRDGLTCIAVPEVTICRASVSVHRICNTLLPMKTATIPSIRVEPDLREQLEQVLREGESLSAFVEASVRENVKRRVDQAAFIQRGISSLEAARRSGEYVSAEAVVRSLEDRLSAARAGKRRKSSSVRG